MIVFPIEDRQIEFTVASPSDWKIDGRNIFYEPEVVNIIGKVVRKGDFVIDGGANFGFFSLIMSQLVGKDGLVMAFEPDPTVYNQLMDNVDANGFKNIACSDVALWNEDCEKKEFWLNKTGYSSFGPYDDSTLHMVRTRKLDTLLQLFPAPRFMKLDCEGAELWILYGAQETLRRGVDYIIVELNYALSEQFLLSKTALREYMASLGYNMFLISVREDNDYKMIKVDPDLPLIIKCSEDKVPVVNVLFSRLEDPLATERN
jgi:FkbM family methyltransferase